jgi:hypothetical protein
VQWVGTSKDRITGLRERKKERTRWALVDAALDVSLEAILDRGEEHTTRFRKVRGLIESTPALMAGQMRRAAEAEQRATAVLGPRIGSDAQASLLVTSFLTVARVAFERCAREGVTEPAELVPRIREFIALAVETLPGAWSGGR